MFYFVLCCFFVGSVFLHILYPVYLNHNSSRPSPFLRSFHYTLRFSLFFSFIFPFYQLYLKVSSHSLYFREWVYFKLNCLAWYRILPWSGMLSKLWRNCSIICQYLVLVITNPIPSSSFVIVTYFFPPNFFLFITIGNNTF